jgi:hypothetical protein
MIATTTTRNGSTIIATDDMVLVASESMPGAYYVLKFSEGWRCDCRGYQFRGTCRHRQAVFAHTSTTAHDDAPLAVGSTDASGLFYAEPVRAAASGPHTFESLFGGR